MKRRLAQVLSLEGLRQSLFLPLIPLRVKNWWSFLLNYIGFKNKIEVYSFRNGDIFHTADTIDVVTLAVVYIKREYGTIPADAVVVDLGANIGAFSIYAARRAKRVVAIEPVPANIKLLKKNIDANHLSQRVAIMATAVGNRVGEETIYLSSRSAFHSFYLPQHDHPIKVPITTVEEVFNHQQIDICDVLKIDIEGAEYDVLESIPPHLWPRIKSIRLETRTRNRQRTRDKLATELQRCGYRIDHFRPSFTGLGGVYWFNYINN